MDVAERLNYKENSTSPEIGLSPRLMTLAHGQTTTSIIRLLGVKDWTPQAAEHYAKIRAVLKQRGTPIGNMDLLIAAHARSLDCVLVSNNVREFQRVEGLLIQNWSTAS